MKKFLVVAVALGMLLGMSTVSMAKTFVDVPSGHWAEDAVQKLADTGLIEGYPDGTFKGDRQLTRYEFAMLVERAVEAANKTFCSKDGCQIDDNKLVTKSQFDEAKDIINKLSAEFKDELAALKVKVDENSAKIQALEESVSASRFGNIVVTGSIRQRIDLPSTDLTDSTFYSRYYGPVYGGANVFGNGVTAGYEMVPSLNFDGDAGDDVTFSLGLDKSIRTSPLGYDTANEEQGELVINHAYVDVDFSPTVRELDLLSLRTGYQAFHFGPYGLLVDNSGVTSNAAVRLNVAKDIVSLTGVGAAAGLTGFAGGAAIPGIGGSGKDAYAAIRLGLNLPWLDLGVNFLADGVGQEKGWGTDIVLPLLRKSSFLTELRAEYMNVTDTASGATPAATANDDSFIIGLDLYKNKRAGLTLSYADFPAAVAYSSMDVNPFTEYDNACPAAGLDVAPASCNSFETDRTLFPAGFEGLGVEASYIVFGNVTLAGKAVLGNFAGGTAVGRSDGDDYPGFGALSVTKPINDKSTFRVEYAQQGNDTVLMNRVRGELLINF